MVTFKIADDTRDDRSIRGNHHHLGFPSGHEHYRDVVTGCFLAMAEKCALAHSRLPAEKNDTTCDETPTGGPGSAPRARCRYGCAPRRPPLPDARGRAPVWPRRPSEGRAETWPRCLMDGDPAAAARAPAQRGERHVSALPADEGALARRQGPLRPTWTRPLRGRPARRQ